MEHPVLSTSPTDATLFNTLRSLVSNNNFN